MATHSPMHCDPVLGESIRDKSDRLKRSLWHGNVYQALKKIDDIESLVYNFEETYAKFKQLVKAVEEFGMYIRNNAHLISICMLSLWGGPCAFLFGG